MVQSCFKHAKEGYVRWSGDGACPVCLSEKILYSYRTYYKAAMRATSLGLCKRVIKHATEDDRKITEAK